MHKVWLKSYPATMPTEVNPDQYSSLSSMLEDCLTRHANNNYSVCMDRWMSYRELDGYSRALGAWLQSQGLEPGARVAIMLPNIPQYAITMIGILRAGYTCVNVNPLYTTRELEHQLNDSGATAIVILENFAHTLTQVIAKTSIKKVLLTSMGDMLGTLYGAWITFAVRHFAKMVPAYSFPESSTMTVTPYKQALKEGKQITLKPHNCTLDSIAFLQYTGGTTGISKGAILTHRNIVAAALQADAWFVPALAKLKDTSKINHISALPLYHIYALTLTLLVMRQGSHITLVPNPRDLDGFIKTLAKRPFHVLPAVNTLFNALLAHPKFKTIDFSSLCLTQAGGMASAESTAKAWKEVTGSPMMEGWGMSENCAIGTNSVVTNSDWSGTIGLPLSSVDLVLRDDDNQNVPIGTPGELCIKGPNVMRGYYNQPEETKNVFTPDGYMRSGDIGIMDESGLVRLIDRKKDMILVSGFNVYPTELDGVISLCPGVLECATIGVVDDKQGEAIKVFIVRSDPDLTEKAVQQYCRENLTGYKRPKFIEFRDELPKSNVGKILRRALK